MELHTESRDSLKNATCSRLLLPSVARHPSGLDSRDVLPKCARHRNPRSSSLEARDRVKARAQNRVVPLMRPPAENCGDGQVKNWRASREGREARWGGEGRRGEVSALDTRARGALRCCLTTRPWRRRWCICTMRRCRCLWRRGAPTRGESVCEPSGASAVAPPPRRRGGSSDPPVRAARFARPPETPAVVF